MKHLMYFLIHETKYSKGGLNKFCRKKAFEKFTLSTLEYFIPYILRYSKPNQIKLLVWSIAQPFLFSFRGAMKFFFLYFQWFFVMCYTFFEGLSPTVLGFFTPQNNFEGPSIKDVRIKGREGESARCRQLQARGRGVGEMRMSAF